MRLLKLMLYIGFACACPFTLLASNYVIINQVMYDTPLNERITVPPFSNGEYIELYNGSVTSVSLHSWRLTGDGPNEVYNFPDVEIESRGYLVVAFRHSYTPSFSLYDAYPSLVGTSTPILYQEAVVLMNTGETLTLYNAQNEVVDQLYYDGSSHLSKLDRLSADNSDSIPENECVSLHRSWVEFDESGRAVPGTSQWKTDLITLNESKLAEPSFGEHFITGSQPLPIGENYIASVSPLDPSSRVSFTDDGISVSSGVRTQAIIQYYDGLGRLDEKIQLECTPDRQDLVSTIRHRGVHRVTQSWLPVPLHTEGQYQNVTDVNTVAQILYEDNRPYHETLYENSALERVIGTKWPGKTWSSYPTSNSYLVCDFADSVRYYSVLDEGQLKTTDESYDGSFLFKNISADEDGKAVVSYIDKLGRLIMNDHAGNRTYYVYDNIGHLRYVLPHNAQSELTNGEYDLCHNTLQASAFCYKYDTRGNIIYKRIPGCEPQYMVYDQLGQLILKQDGNQRLTNKWTLCAYDSIGRNLYTAEIPLQLSHEELITLFADKWSVEHYGNNPSGKSIPGTGYASTILGKKDLQLLTINYYDDYDYLSRLSTSMRQTLRFVQESGYGLQYGNATGLLTGTRIYSLSDKEAYTAYSYYYDMKGQVVQSRSIRSTDNYKTTTSTEYLFDGSVSQQLTEQGTGNDMVREHYRYTYDHAGRALNTYYQLNNDEEMLLSSFSYDETGHLVQNLLHNSQDTIAYSYDIRNMLTESQNRNFSEKLFYADSLSQFSGSSPCYNGNIAVSQMRWKDTTNTFAYTYDAMNRLVESKELKIGQQPLSSEWFRYDPQGNISSLKRYSGNRLIDSLDYYYGNDGNQLLSITDNGQDADDYDVVEYHSANTQSDTTMFYDANGNLIRDLDRGITAIRYNILNLPDTIQFVNGNQIINLYDAAGHKYKSTVYTNLATSITPYHDIAHYSAETDSVVYTLTEYNGNIETSINVDSTIIRRIHNAIGYYTDSAYYYMVKDHLGNICAVVNATTDTVVQRTMYYASGVPMAQSWGRDTQPYLYNGKEFVEAHGLNEYDSQARMYYAPIMRTTTMDPLAEEYYHISPYAWCGNNPIGMVDKNGKYYYDWKNSCYRSSYGDHEEVEWSTIVANRFTEQAPNNELTPLHSVKEFITGRAPLERNLSENDEFVKQIKKSSRLKGIYRKIAKAIANGIESSSEDQNENYNFSLGDDKLLQVFYFAQDVATTYATIRYGDWAGNLVGNMAASVMGSFEFSWEKTGVDYNGNAIVVCHLSNPMSANSLLKVPLIGYTDFWRENVGNKINAYFNSEANETGIMQTVNINMTWTEIIPKSN